MTGSRQRMLYKSESSSGSLYYKKGKNWIGVQKKPEKTPVSVL